MADSDRQNQGLLQRHFERILLVKPSSLGDIVHALPVLHVLRQRYPHARIDWLVASPFASLLEGHDELDDLILFDRRRFGRLARSPRVAAEFIRFVRSLRARRYDLVVDLQGLFRTGLMAWSTGAPVRIGFRGAREGAWIFYTHHLPEPDENTHAVDRNLGIKKVLGCVDAPVRFRLARSESFPSEAAALLEAAGVGGERPLVAVVPGARWETKIWPPERFAAVIDEVETAGDGHCVLLGAPDERSLCDRIAGSCRTKPLTLAGRTSLRQLAAVIGAADAILCQDSAAVHLAVALERPLVCLVGPTNPWRTGPYGRPDDVVRTDVDCAPCYLRRMTQCRCGHRCMAELETATVVAAVRRALKRSGAKER